MKLKIEHKQYPSGSWYYEVYEQQFIFFWIRRAGFFDSLKHAEDFAIYLLELRKEDLKNEKEVPVYYQLDGDKITYKKGDGIEIDIMGEPPLKLKKTEKL